MKKISRKKAIELYPMLPQRHWNKINDDYDWQFPATHAMYTLSLSSRSFRGHIRHMGAQLAKLVRAMDTDKLIFLGDTVTPWLQKPHPFKWAQAAQEYLRATGIGKSFNGAILAGLDELPELVFQLGWLVRTNAVPDIYLTDPAQQITASFCQHGNLHCYTLSKPADDLFNRALLQSKFVLLHENCSDNFSYSGAINGRQIMI